jgi:hypothetical protein
MAIVMRIEIPGGTVEQYDQVNGIMGILGDDDAPDGLVVHTVGQTDDGLTVIDVWESAEKLNRFWEEKAGPAFEEAGVEAGEPEIMQLHYMIPRGQGSQANVIMEARTPIDTAEYDRMVAEIPAHTGDGSSHPVVTHIAAVASDGTVYVADLWDSPDAFLSFAQSEIVPVAPEGMSLDPKFIPVHNVIRGKAHVSA